MSRRMLSILAIAGAMIAAGPAMAQGANQNMQCLMVANVFSSQEKDPQKKQVAIGAAFFYLGRLNEQITPAQLKALILAQSKALTPQTAGPLMNACIKEIGVKQGMMQTAGKELQAAQPAAAAPPKK